MKIWFDSYYGEWNVLNEKGYIIKSFNSESEAINFIKSEAE